ncbi:hypothetical protein MINT15_07810 [Saccharomonospora viridis]|nr:hypothetical protein MINT15_07810 [Saccharomonospora viridis]
MESGSGKVVTADMLENIENPLALATVTWLPPEQGGRRSGPPSAPVYASTTTFRTGDAVESEPGWPATDPRTVSVLLQRIDPTPQTTELVKVGFLAPELARPYLHEGAELVILEGPKQVAHAVITEVLTEDEQA